MITDVREIVSYDPVREVWKHLRLFLNVDGTAERLRQLHKIPPETQGDNLKKQARQIGYCIRQAEEYFKASEEVGLATRPLLLYYGCVALSQALILTKKDGTFSLDASRKSGKHRHHGLELERGLVDSAAKVRGLYEFFSMIKASLCMSPGGEAVGHFPLFFSCLDPPAFVLRANIVDRGRTSSLIHTIPQVCADLQPLSRLVGKSLSCGEIVLTLPDLYATLVQLGAGPTIRPGDVTRSIVNDYSIGAPATGDLSPGAPAPDPVLEKITLIDNFFINGLTEVEKEILLKLYQRNSNIRIEGQFPSNLHLVFEVQAKTWQDMGSGYYPDIVDDLHGQKYFILRPETYLPEPASMLFITYCLGMLSRYFPDVWMTVTDSRVEVAEVTNTLLEVIQRKFPTLILDQITGLKHYIQP